MSAKKGEGLIFLHQALYRIITAMGFGVLAPLGTFPMQIRAVASRLTIA